MSINLKTELICKKVVIHNIHLNFSNDIKNYDFQIIKSKDNINESEIINNTLYNIFLNPDKRYKVIFDKIYFLPENYDEKSNIFGIIDFGKEEILKYCSYKSKNIGFCLYNNINLYLIGAIENVKSYKKYDSSINCIFYCRNDVNENCINELKSKNGDVIKCCYMPNWFMMFVRFFPSENPNNALYMSRDTDCRLSLREQTAISQWKSNHKSFHIIRDHPYHKIEILGGLWGVKNKNIPKIRFMIAKWCMNYINVNKSIPEKGSDQVFLKSMYGILKRDVFVNDNFFTFERTRHHIPHRRINYEYVGEAFNEKNQVLYPRLRRILQNSRRP